MRKPTGNEFSMMIDEVRQWKHNGTPWPVAVGKVADAWGVDRKSFRAEIKRRRAVSAHARAKQAA